MEEIFLPTYLMRHRKENLKKCSLRGLEERTDCLFLSYPRGDLPDLSHHVVLTIDAPALTVADSQYGIFLIERMPPKAICSCPHSICSFRNCFHMIRIDTAGSFTEMVQN